MSFKKIVEEIQNKEENKGFLILIRCGVFFVGVGKDAVILTEKLGITNICFSEGICNSGVPVNKIDKILAKIIDANISVAIYEYNPKGVEKGIADKYKLLRRIVIRPIEEVRKCLQCEKCMYYDKRIRTNIASTKEIIDGIDSILEKKGKIINIEKE